MTYRQRWRWQDDPKFKKKLASFITTSMILWGIWFLSGLGDPWPAWVTVIWGLGLAGEYITRMMGVASQPEEQPADQTIPAELLSEKPKNKLKNPTLEVDEDGSLQVIEGNSNGDNDAVRTTYKRYS